MAVTINGTTGIGYADDIKHKLGTGDDLEIYHDGSDSFIKNTTNTDLIIWNTGNAGIDIKPQNSYPVNLYYNNVRTFQTGTNGITLLGPEGGAAVLEMFADEGDDNDDAWRLVANTDGTHQIETYASGAWKKSAKFVAGNSNAEEGVLLYFNGDPHFQVTDNGALTRIESSTVRWKIHADTNSSPAPGIELMRGTNNTFGADNYTDWSIVNTSAILTFSTGESGSTTSRITINSSGTLTGELTDTSDEKKKKNIAAIPDGAIANIKQLRPVTFNWKDPKNTDEKSGFIAQEVKTVIPNLVVGEEYDESKEGLGYAISTPGVVAHLTKALQEAIAKIETLETKVAALEAHTHE